MYVDSKYGSPSNAPLQKHVEPLLMKHKVDLALWGHHHSYHRSCAMGPGGVCAKGGVTHAVIGAAGYDFSDIASGSDIPDWVEYAENDQYGYARISTDASKLRFEFVYSATGVVGDSFDLDK
jgi:hypothetical protein